MGTVRLFSGVLLAGLLAGCTAPSDPKTSQTSDDLPQTEIVSGAAFLTEDSRALQADDFANPGYLWVERGEELFASAPSDSAPACVSCHNEASHPLAGVSATYPTLDQTSGKAVNIEARINLCRGRYQGLPELEAEHDDLLSLTTYVANLSRGRPINIVLTEDLKASYDLGRAYFFKRKGQLNLSCSQCHDQNWGKRLRGDVISQGHPNGFPAYRLEWQTLGSLHRRFQDCDIGVRAEPESLGSDTYTGLELYLAKRAQGLSVETPAIRR